MVGESVRAFVVAATAAVLVMAGAPAAYAADGAVAGQVADAAGQPLADVCVRVTTPTYHGTTVASGVTGSDGTYDVPVAPGSYHVVFADCGGRDLVTSYWHGATQRYAARVVTVGDGARVTGVDGTLAAGGSLAGRVTDTAGAPLAGARPTFWLATDSSAPYPQETYVRTDADGRFVARGLPPGRYRAEFYAPDSRHAGVYYGDTPDIAQSTELVVAAGEARTGIDARLPRSASISGFARDPEGQPYERVCVRAATSSPRAEVLHHGTGTAADGSYTISRLAPGSYRVEFSDCGNVTAPVWYPAATAFSSASVVEVAEGAAVTGVDAVIPRGLHISGRVVGTDGTPLNGVGVAVYDGITGAFTGRNESTRADGTYTIPNVRGTVYKLHFYAGGEDPDRVDRWWPGVPTKAAALPVSLVAGVSAENIDVVLPRGGQIRGRITGQDGQPTNGMCAHAVNTVTRESDGATPAADGTYLLRGLDTGSYQVFFRSCGSQNFAPVYYGGTDDPRTADLVAVVVERSVTGIDHRATPGAIVSGRVTDTAGLPLGRICVEATRDPRGILGPPGYTGTDEDGRYVIHSLAPHSDYRVGAVDCWTRPARYVETWNGGAASQLDAPPVAAAAGKTTAVADIAMPLGGSFSGTVTDQFGKTLYGVCISAVGGSSGGVTHTDKTGTYALGGLRPGSYTAYFYDCGAGLVAAEYYGDALSSLGAVRFAVREGEDTPGIDVSLLVVTTPGIPGAVGAVAGDGAAVLSWRAPADTGHAVLTAFEVRDGSGTVVASTTGSARSATVRGLANGIAYAFTVNAVNRKGAGDGSAPVSVVPRPAARLSVVVPRVVVSDTPAAISGRLTDPGGAAVAGARVELLGRRRGSTAGMTRYTVATTSATGAYRFAISPAVPMEYAVRFPGSESLSAVKVARVVPVAPRVSWSVSARSVAVVSPAGGGGRARLQVRRSTGWESVVGAYLSSTGRATLRAPAGGTYRVVVVRSGWATATGTSFTVR